MIEIIDCPSDRLSDKMFYWLFDQTQGSIIVCKFVKSHKGDRRVLAFRHRINFDVPLSLLHPLHNWTQLLPLDWHIVITIVVVAVFALLSVSIAFNSFITSPQFCSCVFKSPDKRQPFNTRPPFLALIFLPPTHTHNRVPVVFLF